LGDSLGDSLLIQPASGGDLYKDETPRGSKIFVERVGIASPARVDSQKGLQLTAVKPSGNLEGLELGAGNWGVGAHKQWRLDSLDDSIGLHVHSRASPLQVPRCCTYLPRSLSPS